MDIRRLLASDLSVQDRGLALQAEFKTWVHDRKGTSTLPDRPEQVDYRSVVPRSLEERLGSEFKVDRLPAWNSNNSEL